MLLCNCLVLSLFVFCGKSIKEKIRKKDFRKGDSSYGLPKTLLNFEVLRNGISSILRPSQHAVMSHFIRAECTVGMVLGAAICKDAMKHRD